jgi:hypothetical protein
MRHLEEHLSSSLTSNTSRSDECGREPETDWENALYEIQARHQTRHQIEAKDEKRHIWLRRFWGRSEADSAVSHEGSAMRLSQGE